jgi:hypothetical protein
MSALLVALAQDIAHDFAHDGRNILPQAAHLALQVVEPALQAVEPLVVAVETGFDRRQIVAVATGLFEDVARDRFLAFDLALDDVHAGLEVVELFPGYVRRHSRSPNRSIRT